MPGSGARALELSASGVEGGHSTELLEETSLLVSQCFGDRDFEFDEVISSPALPDVEPVPLQPQLLASSDTGRHSDFCRAVWWWVRSLRNDSI